MKSLNLTNAVLQRQGNQFTPSRNGGFKFSNHRTFKKQLRHYDMEAIVRGINERLLNMQREASSRATSIKKNKHRNIKKYAITITITSKLQLCIQLDLRKYAYI